MPRDSLFAPHSVAPAAIFSLSHIRYLILATVVAVSAVVSLVNLAPSDSADASLHPDCEDLDKSAGEMFVRMLANRTPAAEARLHDAVFRLRRARKNCRYGWVGLAQRDYRALIDGSSVAYNRNR